MTDKNKQTFLIIAGVLLLAIIGALFVFKGENRPRATDDNQPAAVTASAPAEESPQEPAAEIDNKSALSERALGKKNAPVRIQEFASMTCTHCADFYNDTFPKLKKNYIDTGKVFFVFSDYPLNAAAMHASMIARCVPEDQYFDFVENLFAEQDKWGFDPNYLDYLKAEAAKHGVNSATYAQCLQNSDIQQGIVAHMTAAQSQWEISSTPTFVINNKKVVAGAAPYEEFVKMIAEANGTPIEEVTLPEEEPVPAAEEPSDAAEQAQPAQAESVETEPAAPETELAPDAETLPETEPAAAPPEEPSTEANPAP